MIWGIPPPLPACFAPSFFTTNLLVLARPIQVNWSSEKLLYPLSPLGAPNKRQLIVRRVLRNSLRWNPSIFTLPRSDLPDLGSDRESKRGGLAKGGLAQKVPIGPKKALSGQFCSSLVAGGIGPHRLRKGADRPWKGLNWPTKRPDFSGLGLRFPFRATGPKIQNN